MHIDNEDENEEEGSLLAMLDLLCTPSEALELRLLFVCLFVCLFATYSVSTRDKIMTREWLVDEQ